MRSGQPVSLAPWYVSLQVPQGQRVRPGMLASIGRGHPVLQFPKPAPQRVRVMPRGPAPRLLPLGHRSQVALQPLPWPFPSGSLARSLYPVLLQAPSLRSL